MYHMAAIENLIHSESGFGRELWGVLCLELWMRAFIDGEYLNQD
jgi:asparagine synthase (glutamine-hydrolysing)